jgi:hypothetical protein
MIRGRAIEAVQGILEAAFFDVEDVDEEGVDLSAFRGDECLVALCSDDEAEIDYFDRRHFRVRNGDCVQDCVKLLVTFNGRVAAPHCIRWGAEEIATYAGRAAVAAILDEALELRLAPAPGVERSIEPARDEGPRIPHLPIRVSQEQAGLISGISGNMTCRFIPHWFYHYVSSGEKVFKDKVVSFEAEESGAISAINGLKSDIDPDLIENSGIPAGSDVLVPTIQKKEAEDLIAGEVMEQLTRGVRVKKVSGDAILSEDRILRPDRKDITVELQLVYVPVWQIRGKKIIEVNATNGDILCMPMDEGVELL